MQQGRVARIDAVAIELAQVVIGGARQFGHGESLSGEAAKQVEIIAQSPAGIATPDFDAAARGRSDAAIDADVSSGWAADDGGELGGGEVGEISGAGGGDQCGAA